MLYLGVTSLDTVETVAQGTMVKALFGAFVKDLDIVVKVPRPIGV